jgi:hypothetical protein
MLCDAERREASDIRPARTSHVLCFLFIMTSQTDQDLSLTAAYTMAFQQLAGKRATVTKAARIPFFGL